MAKYHNLASGSQGFYVDVCFEKKDFPIFVGEGVGHGAGGADISLEQAVSEKWLAHFEMARGAWLIPFLELWIKEGEPAKEAILETYEFLNKKSLRTYEIKNF